VDPVALVDRKALLTERLPISISTQALATGPAVDHLILWMPKTLSTWCHQVIFVD
jgi:hypothetical protein